LAQVEAITNMERSLAGNRPRADPDGHHMRMHAVPACTVRQ
jgi:hypothetical protein